MAKVDEGEKRDILIKYATGSYDKLSVIFPLLEDESIIEDAKGLARGGNVDRKETRRIVKEVNKALAKQVSKDDLSMLLTIDDLNHGFLTEILEVAKEEPGRFPIEMLSKLIEHIATRFNDNTLEYYLDQEVINAHKSDPEGQLLEALEYTDRERQALSIYTGGAINKREPLATDKYVYEIMNMLMFPGLSNEAARIHEDQKVIPARYMFYTRDLLESMTDIYSVACKYSKTVINPIHFRRMDRMATLEAIENNHQIYSFLSCTLNQHYGDFPKLHTAFIEGDAIPGEIGEQGPIVMDVGRVLGKDYFYKSERELMIAPTTGNNFTIENANDSMTAEEKKLGEAKDYIRIKPGEKPRELTPEEVEEEREAVAFIGDVENTRQAVGFLLDVIIESQNSRDLPFDEVLEKMSPERKDTYLKWKESFQKAFKYRSMRKALIVDRLSSRARQNYENGKVQSREEMLEGIYQELGVTNDLGPLPENHPEEASKAHGLTSQDTVEEIGALLEKYNISEDQFKLLAQSVTISELKDSIELLGSILKDREINKEFGE